MDIIDLNTITDNRGELVPIEFERLFGFLPVRFFYIKNVPRFTWRGNHAHKETNQVYLAIKGNIKVKVNWCEEIILHTNKMLSVPPMVWTAEQFLSNDSILGVFCSHAYDENDYIREVDEFLKTEK